MSADAPSLDPYWEEESVVEKFAVREPDLRLVEFLAGEGRPSELRVLDLGCAGGRNTEFLVRAGCDTWAVDPSSAMVERTRQRLSNLLGAEEAKLRVQQGSSQKLSQQVSGTFDLLVALGVLHMSQNRSQWDQALSEVSRATKVGGAVLVASFTPRTDLTGLGVRPVPGEPHVFDGFPSGRAFVVEADALDLEAARFGLHPATPSRTVEVATRSGRRVTVNALYRRTE